MCTGSIVLAAANLMDGYRAATHWSMEKELSAEDAQLSQLLMQHEPKPPFNAGNPDTAGKKLTDLANEIIFSGVKERTPLYMDNVMKAVSNKKII